MKTATYLLFSVLLIGCSMEPEYLPEPVATEAEPVIIEDEITEEAEPETELIEEVIEPIFEGVYRRSIGSQYEIYDFADTLCIYIDERKIYEEPYIYDETDIIINGEKFPYVLEVDKITICGYVYYRMIEGE